MKKKICVDSRKLRLVFAFSFILLLTGTYSGFAQTADAEIDRLTTAKKAKVRTYIGCCRWKGHAYTVVYKFNKEGRVEEFSNYFGLFGLKRFGRYKHQYNSSGHLSKITSRYRHNGKTEVDTIRYEYQINSQGLVTAISTIEKEFVKIELYQDFNECGLPTTIKSGSAESKWLINQVYDDSSRVIKKQAFLDDSLKRTEFIRYNQFGDIIYSYIPELYDEETQKTVKLIGGSRLSYLEEYEYEYDAKNRWTKKFLITGKERILVVKRKIR